MPTIGPYSLHAIEAGRLGLDGGAMFGIVPKTLWQRAIAPDDRNRIPLNMRCLLIEGNDKLMLVDNGAGTKYDAKFGDIYAIDDETNNLDKSLEQAGFNRADVTDVILTHLHFDHCGGSTERTDAGLRPAFPNAVFHVQRGHWDWANEPNVRERASFLPENIRPLETAGQLNLIDGRIELFESIEVIPVDGHTKEMQLVKVQQGGDALLYMADLVPTHAHLSPAWNMAYDLWPMTTIEEKESILKEAAAEGWRLFFEHDHEIETAEIEMGSRGATITSTARLSEL